MTTFQLTIDSQAPARLVEFWCLALGYRPAPPPEGFTSWNSWYRSVGVPEDELAPDGEEADRIIDPTGAGPEIWFQPVPEPKTVKNWLPGSRHRLGRRRHPAAVRRAPPAGPGQGG